MLVLVDSTTKIEYIDEVEATKEVIWNRKILEDLQDNHLNDTPLFIANTFAIKLTKNLTFHVKKSTSTQSTICM